MDDDKASELPVAPYLPVCLSNRKKYSVGLLRTKNRKIMSATTRNCSVTAVQAKELPICVHAFHSFIFCYDFCMMRCDRTSICRFRFSTTKEKNPLDEALSREEYVLFLYAGACVRGMASTSQLAVSYCTSVGNKYNRHIQALNSQK